MARKNREKTRKGFRDTAAAIAAVAIILVLALPAEASAEYRIKGPAVGITTSCYWIQGAKLFLYEGGKPIPLSEVTSIEEGQFTPLEKEMNRDARKRFFVFMTWVLDREAWLKERDSANLDMLSEVETLRVLPQRQKELRSLTKTCLEEAMALRKAVSALQVSLLTLRIPERSLVIPPEIKSVQVLTWLLSLEERRMYLTTGDPTYGEYTLEHMKQAASFDANFTRAMEKVYGGER